LDARLTRRGHERVTGLREQFAWVRDGRTALVRDRERSRARWWTFGGARANAALAAGLDSAGIRATGFDDLGIGVRFDVAHDRLVESAASVLHGAGAPLDPRRIAAVKFASCVPEPRIVSMLQERDADTRAVDAVLGEPVLAVGR
jgi:ATP-dependent Lhr-like helicase